MKGSIIILLNKIFTPITGNDVNYPYNCSLYDNILFSDLKGQSNIILNTDIYDINSFKDDYLNYKFNKIKSVDISTIT